MEVCYFDGECRELYITELGHSKTKEEKIVNVRVREEYLLHIVVSGVCRFCEFDVPCGNALVISSGLKHHFSVDRGYEHYWFGFGGEKAAELLNEYGIDTNRHVLLPVHNFNYVCDLLELSLKYCLAEKNEQTAVLTLKTCLGLLEQNKKQTGNASDVERATRFMQNNYHRGIRMSDVADHINVSEKHLCRLFVQRLGIPPQRYLIDIRMKKARELLLSTDLRVKEVSHSVGYPSQLNFSAMYKKYYGISPVFERK